MAFEIKESGGYKFIDEGQGAPIVLLHGLFGALSNWETVIDHFSKDFRVIIPMLPIYEMPRKKATLEGLVDYISSFVEDKGLSEMTLMGNSLGGHLALIYTLRFPEKVRGLVLTGSSGLFENSMGATFPKRGNREFIKTKVEYTFYDSKVATPDLVEEIFNTTQSIAKSLSIVSIAKSAQRHNMAKEITKIEKPTLLVWGLNDTITPPMVAHEFDRLIPNTTLRFIDKCCHVPMMEHPEKFNALVEAFINDLAVAA